MHSLDEEYLTNQSIPLMMMSGTLRTLGQYQGKQELLLHQRPQLIKTLKEIAIIQSTESSNRIEGINVPHDRLEKILKTNLPPKNRPEGQVLGYRHVLSIIHTRFDSIQITPSSILYLHKEMLKFTDLIGGAWKTQDNMIEERLPTGEWVTRFSSVLAVETPYYMEQLCHQFAKLWNTASLDRLLIIFAFIFDFLCIHPFADGNGRISRLLTVLLLHKININITRYISYERLIEDTKESYYEILHQVSQNWHQHSHKLTPWLEYNLSLLIAGYKELDERVNVIDSEKGSKTAWVLEIIDDLPDEFSVGQLVSLCPGVSRPMIRHILDELRKQNKLISIGLGRSASWQKR